ncbi:MAG: UDP pyrophosphate synthase, partial [Halapricum sp.]
MPSPLRTIATSAYERLLRWELSGTPNHVAVIQDGNRRYARKQGADPSDGHRKGA